MTDGQSVGLTPVQWIAARAALAEELAPLVAAAAEPGALVDALLAAGRPIEAARCVAGALPPREGIWWAWVSAKHTAQALHGAGLPPLLKLCLEAVEKWITAPTDEHRRAAWSAGDALGLSTAAGATAGAVFLSGGSVAAAGGPEAPPPPGVCGTMVSTAVILAVTTAPPASIAERWAATVQQGRAIIDQLGGWDAAIATTWQGLEAQQQAFARATQPPPTGDAAPAAPAGAAP
jgi:hypothetical protein